MSRCWLENLSWKLQENIYGDILFFKGCRLLIRDSLNIVFQVIFAEFTEQLVLPSNFLFYKIPDDCLVECYFKITDDSFAKSEFLLWSIFGINLSKDLFFLDV